MCKNIVAAICTFFVKTLHFLLAIPLSNMLCIFIFGVFHLIQPLLLFKQRMKKTYFQNLKYYIFWKRLLTRFQRLMTLTNYLLHNVQDSLHSMAYGFNTV